jgi:hypothetical protein
MARDAWTKDRDGNPHDGEQYPKDTPPSYPLTKEKVCGNKHEYRLSRAYNSDINNARKLDSTEEHDHLSAEQNTDQTRCSHLRLCQSSA